MEKIKLKGTEYALVPDGLQLTEQGGKIIFQPGSNSFTVAEADLKASKDITVLDDAGSPFLTRTDLVYAGRVTKDDNYVIGTEQVQTGADDAGEPVYEMQDVTGTVVIAEFRTPDMREQLAAMAAKLDYVAMMSNIDVEEV